MSDVEKLFRRSTTPDGHTDKRMLWLRGMLDDSNLFDGEDSGPTHSHGRPLVKAKGFWAAGTLSDEPYGVGVFWGGELGDEVEIRGDDSAVVRAMLEARQGESFEFAHPGPFYDLQLDNPLSILTALSNLSADFEWHGDKPPGYPRFRDDVVY